MQVPIIWIGLEMFFKLIIFINKWVNCHVFVFISTTSPCDKHEDGAWFWLVSLIPNNQSVEVHSVYWVMWRVEVAKTLLTTSRYPNVDLSRHLISIKASGINKHVQYKTWANRVSWTRVFARARVCAADTREYSKTDPLESDSESDSLCRGWMESIRIDCLNSQWQTATHYYY